MSGKGQDRAKSQIFLDRVCVLPSKIKVMKRLILFSALALLATNTAFAQQAPTSPVYWVVETNPKNTSYSIVRFYDAGNALVHEVTIDGVYINIKKAKHRKKLDLLLKQYNDRGTTASKKNRSRRSI